MRRAIAAREDPDAIYLIDSSIYIFRAWQTSRTSHYVDGQPVNAAIGFTEFVFKLLQRRQPRYIACAFDQRSDKSIRRSQMPQYKANRPALPTELAGQFHLCQQLLNAIGITWRCSELIEADDIIGMWSQRTADAGHRCVIVSADKDLCQFVGREDAIWDFARDTWQDYRAIENRFGVRPTQFADWLALTGDKVDNIPGVPGIGPATAARLLTKWGNIDTLLINIDKVRDMKFRGAAIAGERLREFQHQIRQSRQITGLIRDPSLEHDAASFELKPDFDAVERQLSNFFNRTTLNQWIALLHALGAAKET